MIVAAVALSTAILALPAAADQPVRSEITDATSDTVLADVCSFEVGVHSVMNITVTDFSVRGALTRSYWHFDEQDTFTANGKTLVGLPFTFNIEWLFDSSGNITHAFSNGLVEKIPLPDGTLFVSAGRLDWVDHPGAVFILSPDKGNPGNVAGFCAALSP